MNYYGPRQLADADGRPSGLWHYTVRNGDAVWAIGYCADGCPGHDTPEVAMEHQRQYEVDHAVLDGTVYTSYHACQVCGRLTNRTAMWGPGNMDMAWLCDDHRTRDHLRALVSVGHAIAS